MQGRAITPGSGPRLPKADVVELLQQMHANARLARKARLSRDSSSESRNDGDSGAAILRNNMDYTAALRG